MAQAPQGFTYQGVATDNNGFELQNQSISIQASILSSSATGTTVWQETHTTTTDTFGLFNVTIGEGTSTNGGSSATFQEIDWGAASHFMKVEIDVNGGSNYVHVGTSQMMSVPYALYAENVHNLNMDSILGAVYDSISSSGIDSSEIANMIENAINGYPNDNQNNISDNSIINGYRLFYNRNNRYIFETDSAQVIENQLYDSHVAGYSVEISKLYIDELNQELYFLESHNTSAKGTMVKKTSLSNFDPQTIFIIPGSLSQITDFKVNPLSGEFYWSKCSGSDWGIYNYNDTTGTISYLVNSCVNAFCFNQSGDLFYSGGNLILDDQGSTVFTCPSNIDILEYDNSTFFMIAGNDYVYATSGGTTYDVLYTSPSSTITAMALSNTTQEVIFSYGGVIALADYNATYSQVTSLVQAQSLAVYGPGNINASPLNPIVSYIPNQSYYDLKSIYMIFKNDSIHAGVGSVNSEMLYNTQPFGYIKHLLLELSSQDSLVT